MVPGPPPNSRLTELLDQIRDEFDSQTGKAEVRSIWSHSFLPDAVDRPDIKIAGTIVESDLPYMFGSTTIT